MKEIKNCIRGYTKIISKIFLQRDIQLDRSWLVGPVNVDSLLFGLYGISIYVGYLMPNPFLYKLFYFKQFSLA